MRRIPALVSSVALVTVLASALVGCSAPGASNCDPQVAPGDASALISASGEVGSAKPTIDVPAPIAVTTPQRTVLTEGTGEPTPQRGVVDFEASVIDGASGTVLLQTKYDPSQLAVRGLAGDEGALYESLTCARVGDRISIVSPMGVSGVDTSSVGVSDPDATIVFVIDIVGTFLGKANGVNQLPQDGMPNVVTAPNGTPGITVPAGDAPSSTRIATIKAGSGPALGDGDYAVLHVSIWVWPKDGDQLRSTSSTWDGVPQTVPVVNDPSGQTGVTPGVFDALVGAKVGSQLLAVVAPDDSYREGAWPSGTTAGDTLIYVIDVLGIQRTADAK
ncbi:FKBP-type peptidyl-prolyl cis-trans isomerase [Protaetiibacter larvae]|uniref:peptidylprolyl isomerase n=1 Tax=Protaetiibacter larvae TaxID=2592654 RepID=A0A5C1Y8P7_9MICO|nr:hypothetical protein [Protaetiibacter larvae]QEO10030.1 hypothetical protein FLP23_08440 [Protaetiibacter larvae]